MPAALHWPVPIEAPGLVAGRLARKIADICHRHGLRAGWAIGNMIASAADHDREVAQEIGRDADNLELALRTYAADGKLDAREVADLTRRIAEIHDEATTGRIIR